MPEPSVRIRMYRQGLGDCFLLSFPRPTGAADFHMLVDCGVLQGTDPAKIIEAVKDIKTTTGGHLDLVVMTHEHEDHISGFRQAADVFKEISVGQMWLAWTEDPENPVAVQLRKDRAVRVKAIQAAQAQLEQMNLEHLAVRDQERITEQKVAIQQIPCCGLGGKKGLTRSFVTPPGKESRIFRKLFQGCGRISLARRKIPPFSLL
jgi:glyoxylase-like metal-dependent hydrolase (beta-lactamase superfamily II)